MVSNEDLLKEAAHKLALEHDPHGRPLSEESLWNRTEQVIEQLRAVVKTLQEHSDTCMQPAEEWLLDHSEFIESEVLGIREEIRCTPISSLPVLSQEARLRISSVCETYLELTDGLLDEKTFTAFLASYQEVAVLTIAEAWAVPLFMKMELIRRLTAITKPLKERRAVCDLVERMLSGIGAAELTPERVKLALDEANVELPLSGAMTVHLVRHLRELAEDSAHIGEWLVCKLDIGAEQLDSVLSYEYQLQAEYQVSTGNVIGSLRKLSRWMWSELFEQVSVVEQTLRSERAGDYPKLDGASRQTLRHRVQKLARRMKVTEKLVATQAVQLADEALAAAGNLQAVAGGAAPLPPRQANAAYYLLEAQGLNELQRALKLCGKTGALPEAGWKKRAAGAYFQLLALIFVAALAGLSVWLGYGGSGANAGTGFSAWGWLLALLLLALPASEFAVTAVHWIVERVNRPIRLLRYDFSKGVPEEAETIVVIPVIWSRIEEVNTISDRLELHYLANRDPRIHFAILSDFRDSDTEEHLEDEAVLHAAERQIDRLNRAYPETTFHLFHRRRVWNDLEKTWMGWERKRGKLVEFVKLLKGSRNTSYSTVIGDTSALSGIRYVITLDADTQLPLESAHRMIGAMHLPYNRARLNVSRTRVVEGYGVLQPRIGMTYESTQKSRLAALWASEPGLDPYAFAISDTYQDTMGHGIFTGKGIFDLDIFDAVLGDRFPENRVLSHDLLEGGFLRAGFLSDIELIDDQPATFLSHQKRQHRWTRGDWQLLPWLRRHSRNAAGELMRTDLALVTRWQMVDNFRRSLLQPLLMTILLLAPALPGSTMRWYGAVVLTMLLPLVRQLITVTGWLRRPKSLLSTTGHIVLSFVTLPFQGVVLADAVVRTVYRLAVSKRRLLEWVNQAEVEKLSGRKGTPALSGLSGGFSLIILTAALVIANSGKASELVLGLAFVALWCAAPLVIRWLDQSPERRQEAFSQTEAAELHRLARDIWSFYEDYVTEQDQWLPPDNVQIDPDRGIAHRTSPTNIGMYMTCCLAARDFEFIDTPGLVERLERTVRTIEKLEKWEGHLFNWYDTESLAPLLPVYVSTVDSGNFVACLMTVKEGLLEWLRADLNVPVEPLRPSRPERRSREQFEVAFAEEIGPGPLSDLKARGLRLASRIDGLVQASNFRPLYDPKVNLFSLGYHVRQGVRDNVLYDLLASEARQASFVAIAMGQVSVSHWNALGRTMTKSGPNPVLLSWSGTMFEYLMPWLLMKTYRRTIWDSTYQAVVDRQIAYAEQHRVPFGISESGYYAFDYQMNYQYRAFGVPGLGFKRGLEQDLVLAPYATIMALPFAPREGIKALRQMEEIGGRGQYGFYEAIDFTPRRMPKDRKHVVIRSFMAHHQGMSMLTLSNMLLPRTMIDRFHRNKQVRAAELLLQERIPQRARWIKHPAMHRAPEDREKQPKEAGMARTFSSAHTAVPEVCLLSNGRFSTMVTSSGGGLSSWDGLCVSRWKEEPVKDCWGSFVYIRDVVSDRLWSASYQPCRADVKEQWIRFDTDKATFEQSEADIDTRMDICVSPDSDAEIRRITLKNRGEQTRVLEVTSFVELALSNPIADDAHPAFSKLFIRTSYEQEGGCLVASRRKREAKDRTVWSAHLLASDCAALGPAEFETDRAAFIGRGHTLAEPQSIRSRLKGKTGSVADPAFVMRRRVQLEPGEQVQLFAVTSAAATKEEALDIVCRLTSASAVERAFQLAWTRSRIELRSLRLEHREAQLFQMLAGQIQYTPPFRGDRGASIAANVKGQPGLWSFGVSGDRPVMTVSIDNRGHMPFIVKLLTGHEYLRRLGLKFDLVILNQSAEGYHQDLQESLQRAVEHGVDRFGAGAAGIYVIPSNRLSEEDKTLLATVSRLALRASGPSLATQLRPPKSSKEAEAGAGAAQPEALTNMPGNRTAHQASASSAKPLIDPGELLFFNGWGGFTADGKQYKIIVKDDHHLPAPWINVFANRTFGALVSELGTGYTFWRNSRECKLTPWSNDTVLDPHGELAYIRDDNTAELWTVTPGTGVQASPYLVSHGRGFSRFEHERSGIRHSMTMFVPNEDPVKIMRLRITNTSPDQRKLSVTYFAEWVLGVQRQSNAPFLVSEWNEEASILTAQNRYQEMFREATAFLGLFPQQAEGAGELSWTADQLEFIGRNGTVEKPAALSRDRLSKATGVSYASCGAVQLKLTLQPGEETEVIVLLGCESSPEKAAALALRYSSAAQCDTAWQEMQLFWNYILDQIVVDTPSVETNLLLNGWMLYQTLACRMWARTAFYQAGGAYGFRDQLQDSLALLHTMPQAARKQIVLHSSHQYEEGDVQHWWHEETVRGIRTLFSDDLLWLPYSASRYVEHTGDASVLAEEVPYITSEPLREDEHERYEPTVQSDKRGTVYEHCLKAIDKALSRIGEHGLPLIGVGDWNDGMNLVGDEGRGESVWLGWFLCDVLQRFEPLCEERGETERQIRYREARGQIAQAIHEHGWDGQWYRRAFTDAGTWLGSVHNEECRIDAIAQSWSVISGAAPADRALQAMKSFDRELVDRELAVVKLLTPPFDNSEPNPGYIQGYPPGIRENGAQYTHGVIWGMIAWSQLGRGDKAFELFHMLNPITHTRTDQEVRTYVGEPYVMSADVYTSEPHRGHAGWTWYTGSSGWMYQAGIEWLLGIRKQADRLYLNPCVPADWPGFTVRYRHGGTTYVLAFHRKADTEGSLQAGPDTYIELTDQGGEQQVSIVL
jgi:cyclic beta-1,2-glucan synthetase